MGSNIISRRQKLPLTIRWMKIKKVEKDRVTVGNQNTIRILNDEGGFRMRPKDSKTTFHFCLNITQTARQIHDQGKEVSMTSLFGF